MGFLRNAPKLVPLPARPYGDSMALQGAAMKMSPQMLVFGPGDLNACYSAVRAIVPAFRHTTVDFMDLGDETSFWRAQLPGSNSAWSCLEGPSGSALFVTLPSHDRERLEAVIGDVMLPLERRLPRPWSYAEVNTGSPFPEKFAQIFATARMVDVWEIPELAHLDPKLNAAQQSGSVDAPWHTNLGSVSETPLPPVEVESTRWQGTPPQPPMNGTSLARGQNVVLSRQRQTASVKVQIDWVQVEQSEPQLEHDTSAILLGHDGKVLTDDHFVFYNNLSTPDGCVAHSGANALVSRGCYRSSLTVHLSRTPESVRSMIFAASIDDADRRRHGYRCIRDLTIKVIDLYDGAEMVRFSLQRPGDAETAMLFAELYRKSGEWKFRAIGQGYSNGLRGIAIDYGVNVT